MNKIDNYANIFNETYSELIEQEFSKNLKTCNTTVDDSLTATQIEDALIILNAGTTGINNNGNYVDYSAISVPSWIYQPFISTGLGVFTTNTITTSATYPIKNLEKTVEEQDIKIQELEKQFDLLLKFMVMKKLTKDETEFDEFLNSVEVMDKLCDED